MLSPENISAIIKTNNLLPQMQQDKSSAVICNHCKYINKSNYSFCTNCGCALTNNSFVKTRQKQLKEHNISLLKAENAVFFTRVVLYVMGTFLALGIFFIFADSSKKYMIVLLALILSGLFFSLAAWSHKNPFTAFLTAFVILIAFAAANIFGKLIQSFTTIQGITGMLLCIALLFIVLKGIQAAYRIDLLKQQMQTHYDAGK